MTGPETSCRGAIARTQGGFLVRGPRLAVRVAGAAVFVGIVLAGCGEAAAAPSKTTSTWRHTAARATTSAKSGGASAKTAARSGAPNGFHAFTACLAKHGASLLKRPARTSTGDSGRFANGTRPFRTFSSARDRAAFHACAKFRPAGGASRGGLAFDSQAFAAYRNCLKLHGVILPTRPGVTKAGSKPVSSFDLANLKTKAALTACAPLRPKRSSPPLATAG